LVDDLHELRPRYKLLGQSVASLIPVLCGIHITTVGPVDLGLMGYFMTFVWLVGMSNAFNLIDGVDGLCGTLSVSVALTLGVVVCLKGTGDTGALGFILGACVVGFLVYNKPPARIFMGDGGSQFLGFMIGALPLLKSPSELKFNLFPMVVVLSAIPLLDTVAAIWRRTREGRLFFTPDKRHLHHKLMELGYTTKSILGLLVTIQVGLCGVSILAVVGIGGLRGFIVLWVSFGVMILFFGIIHYTSHAVSRVKERSA
jgi:UDP-GlcNAc:undecaprenyl-phosphate GlcNAc-1-phosphate transferase